MLPWDFGFWATWKQQGKDEKFLKSGKAVLLENSLETFGPVVLLFGIFLPKKYFEHLFTASNPVTLLHALEMFLSCPRNASDSELFIRY